MKNFISVIVLLGFLANSVGPIPMAQADELRLPAPGVRVDLSPEYDPPVLKGIKVNPANPLNFDFILDQGDSSVPSVRSTATRLIKYFLASLTIPEKDLWVNLSPYEKDRIVPDSFGQTEMGRDLLAEDYMLKQITASLIYPEGETGRRFWSRVYQEASRKFGTTNIPVNTFNKVWILPEKAVVYENAKAGTAYVVSSSLKVMLDQDYLSMQKHLAVPNDMGSIGNNIIREIVIPELTREVNHDRNFSQLRQVYNSLILAAWYKKKIKDSILAQVYDDQQKITGVKYDKSVNDIEFIYQRYLEAFKKGVYNYIKEEQDPLTQQTTPRKYFSGGASFYKVDSAMTISEEPPADFDVQEPLDVSVDLTMGASDQAMFTSAPAKALNDILSGIAPLSGLRAGVNTSRSGKGTKMGVSFYRGRFSLSSFVDMKIEMSGDQITFFRIIRNEANNDWIRAHSREVFLAMLLWFREYYPGIDLLTMGLLRDEGNPASFFGGIRNELIANHIIDPQAYGFDDRFDMDFMHIFLKGINTERLSSLLQRPRGDSAQLSSTVLFDNNIDFDKNDLEGVDSRYKKRIQLLKGMKFEWNSQPFGMNTETNKVLSDELVDRRYRWYQEQEIFTVLTSHGDVKVTRDLLKSELTDKPVSFILDEILKNAFDAYVAIGSTGPISFKVIKEDGQYIIEMLDNGVGINFEHTRKNDVWHVVSNPRNNHRFEKEGGMGIGILWSQLLVQLHGGKLEFLPSDTKGYKTMVKITLPENALKVNADSAQLSGQPDGRRMGITMSASLKRLAFHDWQYRRGAVDLLYDHLNDDNFYEWSTDLISNFIDPAGIKEAKAFFQEKNMRGEMDPEIARRNARFATIFALKFDMLKFTDDQRSLRQEFRAWITQRLKNEIPRWLISHRLTMDSPELIKGTRDEIDLIKQHHLGHISMLIPEEFAFLENIRLIYLAAQMRMNGEIPYSGVEYWVYSSIENMIQVSALSPVEKAVVFSGIGETEPLLDAVDPAMRARSTDETAEDFYNFDRKVENVRKLEEVLEEVMQGLSTRFKPVIVGGTRYMGPGRKDVDVVLQGADGGQHGLWMAYVQALADRLNKVKGVKAEILKDEPFMLHGSIAVEALKVELVSSSGQRAVTNLDILLDISSDAVILNRLKSLLKLSDTAIKGPFTAELIKLYFMVEYYIGDNNVYRSVRQRYQSGTAAALQDEMRQRMLALKAELSQLSDDEVKLRIQQRLFRSVTDWVIPGPSRPLSSSISRGIHVEVYPDISSVDHRIARRRADILKANNLAGKPTVFICPTGGTQDSIYAEFVRIVKEEHIDLSRLITFNMDEYYVGPHYQGNWALNPQSYRYYMEHHLFSELRALGQGWNDANVHFLNGQAADFKAETQRYEREYQALRDSVGIDLAVGGIGRDGHIAFIEPVIIIDERTVDILKIKDYNEFLLKIDRKDWPRIGDFLRTHWSMRKETSNTEYLKDEFLKAGIVVNHENVVRLARKLLAQKVTIYLDGLKPADILLLQDMVKGVYEEFGLGPSSVEFKDSSSIFNSRTREVQLALPTIIDNSRYFGKADEIPLTALTIGLGTIMDAKEVMIAATGASKAEPVYAAVAEPETPFVSASSLQRHKNVTFVTDPAAGELYQESHAGGRPWDPGRGHKDEMKGNEIQGSQLVKALIEETASVTLANIKNGEDPVRLEIISDDSFFQPTLQVDVFVKGQKTGRLMLNIEKGFKGQKGLISTFNVFPIGGPMDWTYNYYKGKGITSTILNWLAWEAAENDCELRNAGTSNIPLIKIFLNYFGGSKARLIQDGAGHSTFFEALAQRYGFYSQQVLGDVSDMVPGVLYDGQRHAGVYLEKAPGNNDRYTVKSLYNYRGKWLKEGSVIVVGKEGETWLVDNGKYSLTDFVINSSGRKIVLQGPPSFSQVPRDAAMSAQENNEPVRASMAAFLKAKWPQFSAIKVENLHYDSVDGKLLGDNDHQFVISFKDERNLEYYVNIRMKANTITWLTLNNNGPKKALTDQNRVLSDLLLSLNDLKVRETGMNIEKFETPVIFDGAFRFFSGFFGAYGAGGATMSGDFGYEIVEIPLNADFWKNLAADHAMKADNAALNNPLNKGGIDFDPARMDLQTQAAGGGNAGIRFHLDPAMLAQLQNATGFVPVIINIKPMGDIRKFLGIVSPEIPQT